MKNTVSKLFREYHAPLSDKDRQIINEFVINPKMFLDHDVSLALNIKRLYDKRTKQLSERKQMGI
jgi:hypothetical protein